MMGSLFAWLGPSDLSAAGIRRMDDKRDEKVGAGPIAAAIAAQQPNRLVLLHGWQKKAQKPELDMYSNWLAKKFPKLEIVPQQSELRDPTDHDLVYQQANSAVRGHLARLEKKGEQRPSLIFHLSPGTPTMHAVWLLLGKAVFPNATLLKSIYDEKGAWKIVEAHVPFDIRTERADDGKPDPFIEKLLDLAPADAVFDGLPQKSRAMRAAVAQARLAASWNWIPVLIIGEVGAGKARFAEAIHAASPRGKKPLLKINCGAVPAAALESRLFDKGGLIEKARGATLLLDEIEHLPLTCQIRLLEAIAGRKLYESAATGGQDLRLIATAGLDIAGKVASGQFRQDLYYRLSLAAIKVPALREREGDILAIVNHVLSGVNEHFLAPQGLPQKKLSPSAESRLIHYPWPGNLRQLSNTLSRAALWSTGEKIDLTDIDRALLELPQHGPDGILNRDLSPGKPLDLDQLVHEVERHYLQRAWEQSHHNKEQARKLVGLHNANTFRNRCKTAGVAVS